MRAVMMTQESQVASHRADHNERPFRVRGSKLEGVRLGLDQTKAPHAKAEKQRRNRNVNQSLNANTSSTQLLICHSLLSHPHLPGCSRILGDRARRRAPCGRLRATSNASLPHRHEWTRAGKSSHLSLYTRKVILAHSERIHFASYITVCRLWAPSPLHLGPPDSPLRPRLPLQRHSALAMHHGCGHPCGARRRLPPTVEMDAGRGIRHIAPLSQRPSPQKLFS